ncbi:taurine dioxygenase [Lizonia empirigonia]|nr:taurine dioxygenase [Lizonia empirigonia]
MTPALLIEEPPKATEPSQPQELTKPKGNSYQAKAPPLSVIRPLNLAGAMDGYKYSDIGRYLGREYVDVQISDLLKDADSDAKLRDLAVIISQRGVCVFRNQEITPQEQKDFTNRLGQLTGKPSTSGIHIHPINHTALEGGKVDAEMSTIARNPKKMLSKQTGVEGKSRVKKQSAADGWHHDIGFENNTSDYTSLIMRVVPEYGGDTVFASAYEVYDRISAPYQKFLEGLTCTFRPVGLTAIHPMLRTNPITGWRSVFGVGHHAQRVNELTEPESQKLLKWMSDLITENHDLQLRMKWGVNDLAVWDNRAVYHTATYDYDGPRSGHRVVSVAEAPYLNINSVGRDEAINGKA